jgi:hypothetical protein
MKTKRDPFSASVISAKKLRETQDQIKAYLKAHYAAPKAEVYATIKVRERVFASSWNLLIQSGEVARLKGRGRKGSPFLYGLPDQGVQDSGKKRSLFWTLS